MSCENCEESAYVIDKLAKLLAEIAVIVNGPEPPLTSWSYHDLPEKVRALKQAQQPAALAVDTKTQRRLVESLRGAIRNLDAADSYEAEGLCRDAVVSAARALAKQPAAAVPAGYVPVPVEPTQAMLDAAGMCIIPTGKEWLDEAGKEWLDQSNREVWASMLAAANKENSNE